MRRRAAAFSSYWDLQRTAPAKITARRRKKRRLDWPGSAGDGPAELSPADEQCVTHSARGCHRACAARCLGRAQPTADVSPRPPPSRPADQARDVEGPAAVRGPPPTSSQLEPVHMQQLLPVVVPRSPAVLGLCRTRRRRAGSCAFVQAAAPPDPLPQRVGTSTSHAKTEHNCRHGIAERGKR